MLELGEVAIEGVLVGLGDGVGKHEPTVCGLVCGSASLRFRRAPAYAGATP